MINLIKNWSGAVAIVLVAVIVIAGIYSNKSANVGGVTNYDDLSLIGNITQGRVNSTSTTATAYTLVSGDIVNYSTISITPNGGSLNLTLPASSTLSTWLPNSGDRTSIVLFNATTTAGQQVGLIAGTGSLLEVASSTIGTTALTASTTPAKASRIDVVRKWNTDLIFLVQPYF